MITPTLLKAGDRIGMLATSRKISREQVQLAIDTFQSWGLEVVIAENIFNNSHGYLSGTDQERLKDFQRFLEDESLSAIICARGGYGSTRIIDKVDYSKFIKKPKWITGFSDITAVHLKCYALGVCSIHSTVPMLFPKADSKSSIESLKQLLFEGKVKIEYSSINKGCYGLAEAEVVGGNLSLIVDSIGTSSEVETDGKILFIEEVDEYFYRLDRMFIQLQRAGKLKNLKGLIIGHMTNIKESELSFNTRVEDIVLNAIENAQYPVAFNFPAGHENPNLPWVHGGRATLKVDSSSVLFNYQHPDQIA